LAPGNGAASAEAELDPDELLDLVARGERLGVQVRFWNATEKYRLGAPETICPWPFERAYVASDLRIVPCCFIGNPDVAQIDDDLRAAAEFTRVWHGEALQAHLDGRIPTYCAGCYASEKAAPRPA